MESGSLATRLGGAHWRLWALLPVVALVGAVAIFVSVGDGLLGLVGQSPPAKDELSVRRVEFRPGEIKVRVTNPEQGWLRVEVIDTGIGIRREALPRIFDPFEQVEPGRSGG